MSYPNAALTAICTALLKEWKLTPDQIANLSKDIPGECDELAKRRDVFVSAAANVVNTLGADAGAIFASALIKAFGKLQTPRPRSISTRKIDMPFAVGGADWTAWFDGKVGGPRGYGATEADAIQNLKDMYGEDDGDE